jgi:hypothetical protein
VRETLELIWHPDGDAYAFLRRADGSFSADLPVGEPGSLDVLDVEVPARAVGTAELVS